MIAKTNGKKEKGGEFSYKTLEFLKSQKGWLYLLPMLILLIVFTIYPIIDTVLSAFKNNYDPLNAILEKPYDGWGFENFKNVWKTDDFRTSITNTLIFAFVSVPVSTILALFISVWLNSIKKLQKIYQTIFFLPYLTNALAVGAVFAVIFSFSGPVNNPTSYGLANTLLGIFGLKPINFINVGSSLFWNRVVVILYEIWAALPFKILIIFSALQSVNKQYYDAAKIDGASKIRTLWHVTVPLISPMLSYLVITGFIGGFKEYTAIVGIFGDQMGPVRNEMNTMVGYIYTQIQGTGAIGKAAAGSILLLLLIMLFTGINLFISKKKVHY